MSTPPFETIPDSCAANVVMNMIHVVGSSKSPYTLETQKFKWQGEQWVIDFNLPPFTKRAVASEWIAFGLNLQGTYGKFLMGDPSAKTPRGVATGTPVVDGAGQEGNTLTTEGWSFDTTNIMRKGDYIQIGTGLSSRLHMVTQDANSDSVGKASLRISPALRSSPPDGAGIITSNAKGVFSLVDNTWSWSVSPGPIYRLSFRAEEVI